MDWIAALALVTIAFVLGWFVGNIVESALTYRERRLTEKWIADQNKQLFLEERRDRE